MGTLDLEAFLSGLIHAVNNPLTYVQTNLTSLRRDLRDVIRVLEACEGVVAQAGRELDSEVALIRRLRTELAMDRPGEVLDQIIADAQDGLGQVQVYLRAARAAPRLLTGAPEPIAGPAWLDQIVARHRAGLPAHVVLEAVGEPPADFTGVRGHWEHVVGALLTNAREALLGARIRRESGRIRVTSLPGHVIVDDDGPGVPAAIKERIFLPFFTTRPGAVGLGLALAAEMADAAGGAVALVEGTGPLGGARFSVRLPAA